MRVSTANARRTHGERRAPSRRATPPIPRRVSGPQRPQHAPRPLTSAASVPATLPRVGPRRPALTLPRIDVRRGARALGASLGWLASRVRPRGWIAVTGVLLIGVVALQVSLLQLNSSIGRTVDRTAALERQNTSLHATVSRLSSGDRIRLAAENLGMVMPQPAQVSYLTARGGFDARRALTTMREPDGGDAGLLAGAALAATPGTAQPGVADPTAPADGAADGATTPGAAGASAPATGDPAAPSGSTPDQTAPADSAQPQPQQPAEQQPAARTPATVTAAPPAGPATAPTAPAANG